MLATESGFRIMRSRRGQAVTSLVVLLSGFVLLPLGILAYELSLYELAGQQMKVAIESTALAAAATNASAGFEDVLVTQNAAIATGLSMFKKNSILSVSLSSASIATSLPLVPAAKQAVLYFEFLDPVTRKTVPLGSTNGKILKVTGAFGFEPTLGKIAGLKSVFPVQATAQGGLPMLDVVLCFDISGSMDDFTPITAVFRYKSGSYNSYSIVAQGPLYAAFRATNPTGTGVNATFPQGLDNSTGTSGVWKFSASKRGTNNGAAAPGSYSSGYLTDLVVNIDETSTFNQGRTVVLGGNSYYFPADCVGCLVEAARGNLESISAANTAKVPYASWGITPKSGYHQAYLQAAFAARQPIADAISAAQNFFTIMNNDTDVHFGLVTFSSRPGTSLTSTVPSNNGGALGNITESTGTYASNLYPGDPYTPMPPNPEVELNPTFGPAYSNYNTAFSKLQDLVAYGATDIAGALHGALSQLKPASSGGQGLSRTGSTKAIVLFTDGLPTASSLGGDEAGDARQQATAANQAGIPIYCIGLCLVPSLQASQTAMLTDQTSSPTSGGIAGIAGNGATFYQATQISHLNLVFQNVARSLVQLVR